MPNNCKKKGVLIRVNQVPVALVVSGKIVDLSVLHVSDLMGDCLRICLTQRNLL